jgi:uncharacterized protein
MFEFDPGKSALNKEKHGIDFDEAQALWLDENRVEQAARSEVEERRFVVAGLRQALWCAVYTPRGENTRIISVRRARKEEAEAYERNKNHRA